MFVSYCVSTFISSELSYGFTGLDLRESIPTPHIEIEKPKFFQRPKLSDGKPVVSPSSSIRAQSLANRLRSTSKSVRGQSGKLHKSHFFHVTLSQGGLEGVVFHVHVVGSSEKSRKCKEFRGFSPDPEAPIRDGYRLPD